MERAKRILRKLFCLPPLAAILIAAPSFALVFAVLAARIQGAVAYAAYFLSAYALAVLCACLPRAARGAKRGIANHPLTRKIQTTQLGNRLINDAFFRAELSLYPGLFVNLLYAGIKLFSGIYYRSLWFGALAVYYIFLAAMRFSLLRYARQHPMGQDMARELRLYRSCGIFLLIMNQALAVIVLLVVRQNRGFDYPGLLIYAMALYAFYAVISAAISLARQRKRGSPVLSAAKVVKLTAALVSMLSLETAMLSRFGGGAYDFRRSMTGISGGVVCLFVLGMAAFMIAKSTRQMREIRINDSQT